MLNFARAIDLYIADMRSQGRLNSASSERGYRSTLEAHAEDSETVTRGTWAGRT